MKQGRASHSGMAGTKQEPHSRAVNPGGAGNLGLAQGNHITDGKGDIPFKTTPLFGGRALTAPMVECTTHKAGSQGRHR